MMKKKLFNKKNGFTLIELLVAIAIIGILASLMLLNFSSTRKKVNRARALQSFSQISLAMQVYYDKYGQWPNPKNNGQTFEFRESQPGYQKNDQPAFVPEFYPMLEDARYYCSDCIYFIHGYDSTFPFNGQIDCAYMMIVNKQGWPNNFIRKYFLCTANCGVSCGGYDYYPADK